MEAAVWNFVAQSDLGELEDQLADAGFALRRIDSSDVRSGEQFRDVTAGQLGFPTGGGWDSYADDVWNTVFPTDDEGSQVALVWSNADHLLAEHLDVFATALDVFVDVARQAADEDIDIVTFVLGTGPNFPPLA